MPHKYVKVSATNAAVGYVDSDLTWTGGLYLALADFDPTITDVIRCFQVSILC